MQFQRHAGAVSATSTVVSLSSMVMDQSQMGEPVNITVTRTKRAIVVISDGDPSPEEWLTVCAEHGLTGRHIRIDDYTVDNTRHCWYFTLLPVNEEVEVA